MMREPADWPTRDPLSHRAGATPDRTAVVDVETGCEWTYRAFDGYVDSVAVALGNALSDGASTPLQIGTLVTTRVEFVAAFHACLRIGARVVPLNARLSEREVGGQVERVDPDLLLCERDTEETALAVTDAPVASFDEPCDESAGRLQPETGTGRSVEPARWAREETAVLLFTSGTTGAPNCVRLTLGNLLASATASAFRLGVSPADRWLDCLPVYHMGGLAPLLRCPLYGTSLLVQEGFDANATAQAGSQYRATGVSLVPTQLKRLLDAGWRPPDSLETVLLGGAPAAEDLIDRALDREVPLYPTYGLTEAASQVATATPDHVGDRPGSVGQPLVFTDVTIVDGDGTPVEAGETGEIVIDGPTVTPGYLDDERTTDAFGEYGLHTGDVGYEDEDGRLWVLGRLDETIITGGENVHPQEVESTLRDHPGVSEAAVVGLPDAEWGERVGALVAGEGVTPDAVEAFARDSLASYKVPRTITIVSNLPRTPSGTVDRKAVRDRLTDR